jgi:hypothetical protein
MSEKIKIIQVPMSMEEARKIFPYRPFSKHAETRHGGNSLLDDKDLLRINFARPCTMCSAPTKKLYLVNDVCPDCDGRAERAGKNPYAETQY